MYNMTATTRERLIEGMQALLAEEGYAATSPRDVLDRTGAGQGSLYHHFRGGKAELAAAALGRTEAQMRTELDALLAGPDPVAAVRRFVLAARPALRGCRLGRLSGEQAIAEPALRAPVGAYLGYVEERLTARLTEAERDGRLAAGAEPAAVAAALVAVIQGAYVLARAHADEQRFVRAQRGAAALLDAAVRR
jgi:AcrR family transcriptional regulator